jgi:hypothetical protein
MSRGEHVFSAALFFSPRLRVKSSRMRRPRRASRVNSRCLNHLRARLFRPGMRIDRIPES